MTRRNPIRIHPLGRNSFNGRQDSSSVAAFAAVEPFQSMNDYFPHVHRRPAARPTYRFRLMSKLSPDVKCETQTMVEPHSYAPRFEVGTKLAVLPVWEYRYQTAGSIILS